MRIGLFLTLALLILLSGCTKPVVDSNVINQCVSLCENVLKEGKDLSNGPCLSDDNLEWRIEGWVCDVVHSPRQAVDNQKENQCNEWWEGYQKGSPPNFIEITPECEFIKTG